MSSLRCIADVRSRWAAVTTKASVEVPQRPLSVTGNIVSYAKLIFNCTSRSLCGGRRRTNNERSSYLASSLSLPSGLLIAYPTARLLWRPILFLLMSIIYRIQALMALAVEAPKNISLSLTHTRTSGWDLFRLTRPTSRDP